MQRIDELFPATAFYSDSEAMTKSSTFNVMIEAQEQLDGSYSLLTKEAYKEMIEFHNFIQTVAAPKSVT